MSIFRKIFDFFSPVVDVDLRLATLGFRKTGETKTSIEYMRYNEKHRYTQIVEVCAKMDSCPTICSYSLEGTTSTGSPVVALTLEEAGLFITKAEEIGLYERL